MPPETTAPQTQVQFRFFVLTCRDPRSDFRQPFVEELKTRYETHYIWLRRRPIVVRSRAEGGMEEMSPLNFLIFMRRFPADNKINVYFNSTNTSFPVFSLFLKLMARRGLWCLDLHDDLRYHYAGVRRLRTKIEIALLRLGADVTVHAAPTLVELAPRSMHLGNASHLTPLSHDQAGRDKVLILASFDERFDFGFLAELSALCPAIEFHLHGWTRHDDPATFRRIEEIVACTANVHYHGAYGLDDLPLILQLYRISLAPYLINTKLTRYIDPLRFYHCLNAGLEVVSTDVPQARFIERWLHVAKNPAECGSILEDILAGRRSKLPFYSPVMWADRVDRLVEILRMLPRTLSLSRARAAGFRPPSIESPLVLAAVRHQVPDEIR